MLDLSKIPRDVQEKISAQIIFPCIHRCRRRRLHYSGDFKVAIVAKDDVMVMRPPTEEEVLTLPPIYMDTPKRLMYMHGDCPCRGR